MHFKELLVLGAPDYKHNHVTLTTKKSEDGTAEGAEFLYVPTRVSCSEVKMI